MKENIYPLAEDRVVLLSDSISQNSVGRIIDKIFEINKDDAEKEQVYKDWKREPILLFINSYGGSVYDGLALVDVIKKSKTPVHTICIGSCMSMGLWVWLSGKKKLIGETATLMFHDISTWSIGKTEEIKQDLNEMLRLQKILIDTVTKNSSVTEDELRDYITKKSEWYIPADKAIELRLADAYY